VRIAYRANFFHPSAHYISSADERYLERQLVAAIFVNICIHFELIPQT
jgi:hypothetical protein